MGDKSGNDVAVNPSEVFPGLATPSFALLRSQREPIRGARITGPVSRGSRTGSGRTALPNIFGTFLDRAVNSNFARGDDEGPYVWFQH